MAEGNAAQLYIQIARQQARAQLGLSDRQARQFSLADPYAERLLLGSLLLHRLAREAAALAGLRASHFYDPDLGRIYDRVMALHSQDYELSAVDPRVENLLELMWCWSEVEHQVWNLDIQAWYTQSPDRQVFATPPHVVTRQLATYIKQLWRRRQRRAVRSRQR